MEIHRIIQQVKDGNRSAFRHLVMRYGDYAFKLAFRIMCNEEDAKDVVQESFIKIWVKIRSYDVSVKFTTWMYKIVTRTAIDHYRKNERKRAVLPDVSFDAPSAFDAQTDHSNKDLSALIEKIAGNLPEKQRLVFVLRDIQGFTTEEVTEILEMPETSVKSNLYHARKTVREKLMAMIVYERR